MVLRVEFGPQPLAPGLGARRGRFVTIASVQIS